MYLARCDSTACALHLHPSAWMHALLCTNCIRECLCWAQERIARQAEELRKKLAGIHPDGPSREERYQRRMQQIDNGETPSRGTAFLLLVAPDVCIGIGPQLACMQTISH